MVTAIILSASAALLGLATLGDAAPGIAMTGKPKTTHRHAASHTPHTPRKPHAFPPRGKGGK